MYLIVDNSEIEFKNKIKIIEHVNFEYIFDCDIFFFNINLENIVFWAILYHIYVGDMNTFVDKSNDYLLIYNILKNKSLL